MSLDDLGTDIETEYTNLDDELSVSLDAETKNELALLVAALEPEDTDELVRRAIHLLFQSTAETGSLDFQLRRQYDVTYDEYLSGMTYDQMSPDSYQHQSTDEDRRYQF